MLARVYIQLPFSIVVPEQTKFNLYENVNQGYTIRFYPPKRSVQTEQGWLILYHGVRTTASGSIYRLGLALLDLKNPAKVLKRTDEWVFGPKTLYEREGDVDDVVFPCGWIKKNDEIFIYYGAADSRICLATVDFQELMDFVLKCPQDDCIN